MAASATEVGHQGSCRLMGWLWQNGALSPEGIVRIDPADRGLLLGDGLFETMRARSGRVPLLAMHLARLSASAGILGIALPYAAATLDTAIQDLLHAQTLADGAVRLTLTRGPGPRGLAPPDDPAPFVMIRAMPLAAAGREPARAIIATIPRNERSPLAGMKTLGCLDQILCLREAGAAGCNEAIMTNTRGDLACATSANLFVVRAGRIATPDLASGVLPGTTRARLLEAWPRIEARPLTPADLHDADETFLTNSLVGVRPLVAIDGRPIGTGTPGPLTSQAADLLA